MKNPVYVLLTLTLMRIAVINATKKTAINSCLFLNSTEPSKEKLLQYNFTIFYFIHRYFI